MSVHGDHAYTVSRILYKSTAQVTYIGTQEKGLAGITLSYNLFPVILKELLIHLGEYAVELYENTPASSGCAWVCKKRGSPAMWRDFESELSKVGDLVETPVVCGVTLGYSEGASLALSLIAFYFDVIIYQE